MKRCVGRGVNPGLCQGAWVQQGDGQRVGQGQPGPQLNRSEGYRGAPYRLFTPGTLNPREMSRIAGNLMSAFFVDPAIGQITQAPANGRPAAGIGPDGSQDALRAAAQDLEAAFLSEMLKQARFGEARGAFGGGVGEEQFASFLRDQHARAMVDAGGLGLADAIFAALVARTNGDT